MSQNRYQTRKIKSFIMVFRCWNDEMFKLVCFIIYLFADDFLAKTLRSYN